MPTTRDEEARQVVTELEARIGDLRASVAALTALLRPPGEEPARDRASA